MKSSDAEDVMDKHHVNGNRMVEPFPEGTQMALFASLVAGDASVVLQDEEMCPCSYNGEKATFEGMGCFWGAERKFWRQKGVYSTQVGYAGGHTPNPTYKEVCSGRTGHTEAVRVVYQPENISFEQLLKVFWENHDPTQGMRQGNDVGTQYRSAIYTFSQEQMEAALRSKEEYQKWNQNMVLKELKTLRGSIVAHVPPLVVECPGFRINPSFISSPG
ncbi:Peptide methionine sulfoxide reductase MsrA [Pitangus sulphuratus]|nr:Peptide methionine sulfoxide reductase MsrA [Pitangus sulphuratus]